MRKDLSDVLAKRLRRVDLEARTAAVDAVSGATLTSILQANCVVADEVQVMEDGLRVWAELAADEVAEHGEPPAEQHR